LAQKILGLRPGQLLARRRESRVAENGLLHLAIALRHFRLKERASLLSFGILRILDAAIGSALRVAFFAATNREQFVDAPGPIRAGRNPKDGTNFLAHLQFIESSECRRISYEPNRDDRFISTKFDVAVRCRTQLPNEHAGFVARGACEERNEKEENDKTHHRNLVLR